MEQERIQQIFQRLQTLFNDRSAKSSIDLDLMLDYTRVLYADLLEMRKNTPVLPENLANNIEKKQASNNATKSADEINPINLSEKKTSDTLATTTESSIASTNKPFQESDAESIVDTVEELKNDSSSAIAYEPPNKNKQTPPQDIKEGVEEEAPAPPTPEPIIIPAIQDSKKDIRSSIGINDKYLFLNELFNNHKSDYEAALDELNKFKNFDEGLQWVKAKSATKSVWDEEGDTVQNFLSVVKKHFSDSK